MPEYGEAEALAEPRPATPGDASPGPEAREVGARLREARVALGRARADIARELRIREVWLEAIEEGRLGELPGAPFRSGFVKSYADRLGLDGAAFAARLGAAPGASGKRGRLRMRLLDEAGRLLSGYRLPLLATMLAVAIGGGWYLAADGGAPVDRAGPVPERSGVPPALGQSAREESGDGPGEAAPGGGTRVTGGAGGAVFAPAVPVEEPAAVRSSTGSPMPGPAAVTDTGPPGGDGATVPVTRNAERIRAVQRALSRLGYDPGPVDGAMGPRTRAAIRAFQAASGLAADGRLTPEVERDIRLAAAAAGS